MPKLIFWGSSESRQVTADNQGGMLGQSGNFAMKIIWSLVEKNSGKSRSSFGPFSTQVPVL
jgi:hypothetical protein